jgi:glycosyltransferase involved in cell wall biosynthesis
VARLHVRHLVRSDGFAGVERYLTYLAPEQVRRGHTVSVVGGRRAEMEVAFAGTGVTWTPARTTAEVVRAAVAGPRPDLLHAHMTAAELAAVIAGLRWRCPVVATLHFVEGRGHSSVTRLAYRAFARRLDAEIAVSRHVAEQLGGRAIVLPLGIPDPGVDPDPARPRRPVVLVAQRLEREKDTDVALRAWAESGLGDEGWELHVAGAGACEPELRELASRLDPDGHIRFLGQVDLTPPMAEAALLLAPRGDEAFGLTVVEAMAAGLPVAAAAGAGHLETIGPASPDTLFPIGDAAAAATVIARLAHQPDERARLAAAGRARFEQELRIDRHTDGLEKIYREVLGRGAGRRVAPPSPGGRPAIALVFPGCHREGGVERVVRELARRAADTFDVTFVGDRFDPEGMGDVRFLPLPASGPVHRPGPIDFRHRAQQALATLPADLVVGFGVESPPPDVAVVQSVHAAWLSVGGSVHTPIVDVPAGARRLLPRHQVLLGLERSYFHDPRLRRVLACSAATADEVTEQYGLPADRVGVMTNAFDPAEFNRDVQAAHRPRLRAELGLADEVVALFVANELHRKGFATLLEAVAQVHDHRLRIELVGRAAPHAYADLIAELGLERRVRWNGPQSEVAPWYAIGDLFVLPTAYEPFGNVIVEALACGLPVITSRTAGASIAVHPGVDGWLLDDPTDAAELAAAIQHAVAPGTLERWSAHAGEGLDAFTWDAVGRQFTEELSGVLARRNQDRASEQPSP